MICNRLASLRLVGAARGSARATAVTSQHHHHHLSWQSHATGGCYGGAAASPLETRPIYSLGQQRRCLANTTSGTFAPAEGALTSARATSGGDQRAGSEGRGQQELRLNIFDDSDHLPSLPVPPLGATLERLKETIWPIAMNSAEFAHALELVEAFAGPAGQKLDLLLRAKASQTKNWLTHDWWTQEAYLKSRAPLAINSNPAMIYPPLAATTVASCGRQQLVATMARLISGVIDFKVALLQGYNPEWLDGVRSRHGGVHGDEFRLNGHLCYNQYRHIFGSTRLPGELADSVLLKPLNDDLGESDVAAGRGDNFSLVFSHRGRFHEIQLASVGADEAARVATLASVLSQILASSEELEQEHGLEGGGVGILTADRRDRWARNMRLLEGDSLRAIRDAHLVVCLDTISSASATRDKFLAPLLTDTPQSSNSPEYLEALSRQVLHSDRENVGNRWFDKSLQLVVVADEGAQRFLGAGINYEHSVAEAVVVTKLIEYSHDRLVQGLAASSGSDGISKISAQHTPARYRQLRMVPPAEAARAHEISASMAQARQDFVAQLDQFELAYFNYRHYGAGAIKAWRFSPDSWFQVGLQLAHFQLHKRLGPCYESASTRQFAYGRTETIRSLTKDVAEFCQAPSLERMRSAIGSHKSYANAANAAAAIDRVLLGYRLIFNELKANHWAWGLPTFENGKTREGATQQQQQLRFHSLDDTRREAQQVDLNDLFTESELNVLGAFFNNELIERSKKFALSTSQVSSVHPDICMSYGPLLADGYGCCYNLSSEQIVAAITANSSNQSFSCEVNKFSESLGEALDRMRDIVTESQVEQHQHQRSSKN